MTDAPAVWFRRAVLAPAALGLGALHHYTTHDLFSHPDVATVAYADGSLLAAALFVLLPWRLAWAKWVPGVALAVGALAAQAPTALGLLRTWPIAYTACAAVGLVACASLARLGAHHRGQRLASMLVLVAFAVGIAHPVLIHRTTFRLPDAERVAAFELDPHLEALAWFAARPGHEDAPVVALGDPREVVVDADGRVFVVYGGDSGGGQGLARIDPDGTVLSSGIGERGLVLDAERGRLVLVKAGLDELVEVDVEDLRIVRRLSLPFDRAERVVADPASGRLFVVSEAGRLLAVDAERFAPLAEVALPGIAVKDLRVVAGGIVSRAYDGHLARVNPRSLEWRARRLSPLHPGMGLAVAGETDELWVPTMNGTGLLVLDGRSLRQLRRVEGPWNLRRIAVVPEHDLVVGGDFMGGRLHVLRASDGDTLGSFDVGWGVRPVEYDAPRARVIVGSNFGVFALDLEPWTPE